MVVKSEPEGETCDLYLPMAWLAEAALAETTLAEATLAEATLAGLEAPDESADDVEVKLEPVGERYGLYRPMAWLAEVTLAELEAPNESVDEQHGATEDTNLPDNQLPACTKRKREESSGDGTCKKRKVSWIIAGWSI